MRDTLITCDGGPPWWPLDSLAGRLRRPGHTSGQALSSLATSRLHVGLVTSPAVCGSLPRAQGQPKVHSSCTLKGRVVGWETRVIL